MKNRNLLTSVSRFSIFIMLAIFTLSALLLVIIGTGVYNNIVEESKDNYKLRTSITYVTGKIRSTSLNNNIVLKTTPSGNDMLCIIEEYDGIVYETRIFEEDNHLYECFVEENEEIEAVACEEIAEITKFKIRKINDKLLEIIAFIDDNNYSVDVLIENYYLGGN